MHHAESSSPDLPESSDFSRMEEELNLFLDGELPMDRQGAVYAHLADSVDSRSFMDQVMLFRRMSRQEYLEVPPSVDEAFFARLDALKSSGTRVDRFADREPLWNSRRPVSVRAAIAAVVVVFMVGWMLPFTGEQEQTAFLSQEEERVLFDTPQARVMQSYIYVFEPGLTIEADAE